MRPFDDDYDDLDDFEFDSLAASRNLLRDRQHHHKSAGRRRHKAVHKERWESEHFSDDDFDDVYDRDFENYYDAEFDH